jgi:hypothetical protein
LEDRDFEGKADHKLRVEVVEKRRSRWDLAAPRHALSNAFDDGRAA